MKKPASWILVVFGIVVYVGLLVWGRPTMAAPKPDQALPSSTQGIAALDPDGGLEKMTTLAKREGREKPDIPFLEQLLPEKLDQIKVLHVSFSRWISYVVVLPLLMIVARLVGLALVFILRPLIRRIAKRNDDRPIQLVKNPFSLFVLALAMYGYAPLTQSNFSRLFWTQLASTLTVVSLTWLCLRLIDVLADRVSKAYQMTASSGRVGITRLIGQFAKGLSVIVGAAVILAIAGINLTAVLTGVGVGGIAIAFAAQKTLENLFGGIMIASDQPIRVGDFCRAGGYSGTVEGIGLRSTRIRTIDRTLVSVPNGQLSVMSLENFAMRDKIRLSHTLGLRMETTADQLHSVLGEVRALLARRSEIEQGTARVHLVGVKNGGIEIELFAYVSATSWEIFLDVQEELLLQIINIVQEAGTTLAYPGGGQVQTTTVGGQNDSEKGRRNSKEASRKRRDQGELV